MPRVPPLHRARAAVWAVLGLLALHPLWPASRPPVPGLVAFPSGCRLAPATSGPECSCTAWPGRLRVLLGVPLPLNRAGPGDLRAISGIGPVRAAAIVRHRAEHGPFARVDDLGRVRGIGPATLERLRSWLFVGSEDPACAPEAGGLGARVRAGDAHSGHAR